MNSPLVQSIISGRWSSPKYDQLIPAGELTEDDRKGEQITTELMKAIVPQIVVFDITDILSIQASFTEEDQWHLPFASTLFRFSYLPDVTKDHNVPVLEWAIAMHENNDDDDYTIQATIFNRLKFANDDIISAVVGMAGMLTDRATWRILPCSIGQYLIAHSGNEEESRASFFNAAEAALFECFNACQLLSCKNITTERVLPSRQVRRDYERRGQQMPNEHRIVVRVPGKKTYTLAGPRRPGEQPLPAHMVRGHFSEYTPERPLFGKYAGRFWIPAHVRGVGDAQPREYIVQKDKEVA